MLESLISSKTRIKLLMKFFINGQNTAWLRGLESEFGESSNAIRIELNRLEKAGLIQGEAQGNKKMFKANISHPLFHELHNIVLKTVGIDHIINSVVEKLGEVEKVFLSGELAKGMDSKIVDLIIIGKIDRGYLQKLSEKAEKLVKRNIRSLVLEQEALLKDYPTLNSEELLLIWSQNPQK
jgi:hypothetical protein